MDAYDRRIHTLLETYGVDNVSKIPEVQSKRRATFASKRDDLIYVSSTVEHYIEANNLRLFRLNKTIADEWLDKYHPLQAPRGNILSLGLVGDDMIYCIMTFKKSRNPAYNVELSRMWTLPRYQVLQGYDVLSQYASELGLYNIVAYVNKTFENPGDYAAIGMKHIRDIQRTKWWINSERHMSDASRRQYKIKQEALLADGWLPVYDCGQAVFVFE